MYVRIIDKGECFSTTGEQINGIYANKKTWETYNFYPKNGMVGEVVAYKDYGYILKIKNGIYVPMTYQGVQEISYEEYINGLENNNCTGMDEKQKSINDSVDMINNISGYDWERKSKPTILSDSWGEELKLILEAFDGELPISSDSWEEDIKSIFNIKFTTVIMYKQEFNGKDFLNIAIPIINNLRKKLNDTEIEKAARIIVMEFNSRLDIGLSLEQIKLFINILVNY